MSNLLFDQPTNPYVKQTILHFAGDIDNCAEYNWCEYLIECLKKVVGPWIFDPHKKKFTGSVPFIVYLFVDRIVPGKRHAMRTFPTFASWTDELLCTREAKEHAAERFGIGRLAKPLREKSIDEESIYEHEAWNTFDDWSEGEESCGMKNERRDVDEAHTMFDDQLNEKGEEILKENIEQEIGMNEGEGEGDENEADNTKLDEVVWKVFESAIGTSKATNEETPEVCIKNLRAAMASYEEIQFGVIDKLITAKGVCKKDPNLRELEKVFLNLNMKANKKFEGRDSDKNTTMENEGQCLGNCRSGNECGNELSGGSTRYCFESGRNGVDNDDLESRRMQKREIIVTEHPHGDQSSEMYMDRNINIGLGREFTVMKNSVRNLYAAMNSAAKGLTTSLNRNPIQMAVDLDLPSFDILSQNIDLPCFDIVSQDNCLGAVNKEADLVEGSSNTSSDIGVRSEVGNDVRERPMRKSKLTVKFCSPFVVRATNMKPSVVSPEETNLWNWLCEDDKQATRVLFQYGDVICRKFHFKTLLFGEYVSSTVVDAWTFFLNHMELRKSPQSPRRLYCTTQTLVGTTDGKTDLAIKRKCNKFAENLDVICRVHSVSMHCVDMIFFPTSDGNSYYVVCYNMKTPEMEIIDNRISKQSVAELYGPKIMALHYNFVEYLTDYKHGKVNEIRRLNPKRMEMPWQTKKNFKDSGVFAMRHMEMYMGGGPKKRDSGFHLENVKQ